MDEKILDPAAFQPEKNNQISTLTEQINSAYVGKDIYGFVILQNSKTKLFFPEPKLAGSIYLYSGDEFYCGGLACQQDFRKLRQHTSPIYFPEELELIVLNEQVEYDLDLNKNMIHDCYRVIKIISGEDYNAVHLVPGTEYDIKYINRQDQYMSEMIQQQMDPDEVEEMSREVIDRLKKEGILPDDFDE